MESDIVEFLKLNELDKVFGELMKQCDTDDYDVEELLKYLGYND